jgi:Na+/glutamate symporter
MNIDYIINYKMDKTEDLVTAKLAMLLGSKLDAKTKFKLLDMIDPRPIQTVGSIDALTHCFTEEKL